MGSHEILAFGLLTLAAILALILLVWRRGSRQPLFDEKYVSALVSQGIQGTGLLQRIGELQKTAADMASATQDLQNLFKLRAERGAAGEFQLEQLLGDMLPSGKYAIRQNVPGLGTPDASIQTSAGRLIIDAKFPLEAYAEATSASDATSQNAARKRFGAALRAHVEAVATKYVRPEAGTHGFAILFVPSEAVFAQALDWDPGIVADAASQNVVLAGPTTLAAQLLVVAAGVRAEALSQAAARLHRGVEGLGGSLEALRSKWETHERHVANAQKATGAVKDALDRVEEDVRRLRRFEEEQA